MGDTLQKKTEKHMAKENFTTSMFVCKIVRNGKDLLQVSTTSITLQILLKANALLFIA